jgi:hypothetical protein
MYLWSFNVVYWLESWDSIVKNKSKIIEYLVNGGVGIYCEKLFFRSIFFQEKLYPPLDAFLW